MRSLFALALAATLAVTAVSDDNAPKKKKGDQAGRSPLVTRLTKSLEETNLSDEQQTQVKAAKAAFMEKVKQLRKDGLTPELMKKRAEAMKSARQGGLKAKELQAKINESLSADEIALFEKMNKAGTELQQTVAKTLTKEQMEALPEAVRKQLQNAGKQGKGRGKGKGKNDAI